MKKALLFGVVGILLLTIVGLAVFVAYLDAVVKAGIEAVGPKVTGTTVTVESVKLSFMTGEGRVKGLVIGNPKGYQSLSAFKLGDARVKVNVPSALTDKLIIDEIVVDAPDITYEVVVAGSNIAKIQENVSAFAKSLGSGESAPKPAKDVDAHEKKVQINHFIVRNGHVNASTIGRTMTVPLPEIHLKDLGKDSQGTTVQMAFAQVIGEINKSALQAVASSGKFLEKGAEAVGEAAKGLGSEAEKSGSKAMEGVKGLFGK
jgi:Cu/Ag efflux protein CusF